MVSYLYAVVGVICLAVMLMLMTFTIGLRVKEHFNALLPSVFGMSVFYCICESVWGFMYSGLWGCTPGVLTWVTVLDLASSAVIVYLWFRYTGYYLEYTLRPWQGNLMLIPLVISVLLTVSSPFTGLVFTVDENMVYYAGPLRFIVFGEQYFYMAMILVATHVRLYRVVDDYVKKRLTYVSSYIFLIIVFAVMQHAFPYSPMSPIGYMLAAIVAFVGNLVRDREKNLKATTEFYQDTSVELYRTLEAIGKAYVSIHVFDLELNMQTSFSSTEHIDKFILPEDDGATQIKKVMRGVARYDFVAGLLEFVNLDTLPDRMEGKEVISYEFIGKNEGWCMSSFIRMESDENGRIKKVIHAVQNIDEAKRKEMETADALKHALEDKNVIYSEMLRGQQNGVIASDEYDKIVIINDAAAQIFGYDNAKKAPDNMYVLMEEITLDNNEKYEEKLAALRKDGESFTCYFSVAPHGKNLRYIMAQFKSMTLADGRRITITSMTDITRNREIEDELTVLSETDALTGINNRGSGEGKIEALLSAGETGMLCLIDVDKFKSINDTYGHQVGDKALIAIANTLKSSFRDSDIVMRLGGDEFAAFAVGMTSESVATNSLNELIYRVSNIRIPEAEDLRIGISAGISFAKADTIYTFAELYRRSDSVMYECKAKSESAYAFYSRNKL